MAASTQDQARLMVVSEARPRRRRSRDARETAGGGADRDQHARGPELVYAHPLKGGGDLAAGEQYVIEAKLVTAVDARAPFSTEIFLTKDRDARRRAASTR